MTSFMIKTGRSSPVPPARGRVSFVLLLRLALAAAGLIAAAPALACSVCGCGDPLISTSDPAATSGTLRLQLDGEFLRIDAGTDGVPGSTDQLTQRSYRLNVAWRPIEPVTLSATLPVVSKRIRAVGNGTSVTNSDLTGIGDAELSARYTLLRSVMEEAELFHELAVSIGTAIPTGAHDAKEAGALIDPHGQLGTGGWGPFAGLHYRVERGEWTGFASLSFRVRTEASYFDGTRYKFGDALLWSLHGQYLVAHRVALDLGLDGRDARADRMVEPDGTLTSAVGNTGGTLWSLAPGVYVDATAGFWIFARGQVPVVKRLLGEQDVKPSFTVGVQVLVR
jgi:hypothetical protein